MHRLTPVLLLLIGASGCTSNGADASPQGDASGDAANVVIRCSSSLASLCQTPQAAGGLSCPPPASSGLPGPWCTSNPTARAILGACAGYALLAEGYTDTANFFMYSADSGSLEAVLSVGENDIVGCIGGDPSFAIPASCFSEIGLGEPFSTTFNGAGAAPGCSTFDAGAFACGNAVSDAGCPADEPEADAPCSPLGLVCPDWGTIGSTTTATCSNTCTWTISHAPEFGLDAGNAD